MTRGARGAPDWLSEQSKETLVIRGFRLSAAVAVAAAAIAVVGCGSTDPEKARVEALRRDRNVEALAKETVSEKPATSREAVRALGTLGAEAIPRLQEVLKDERPEIRVEAALAYGNAVAVAEAAPARAAPGQEAPGQAARMEDQIRPLAEAVRSDASPDVRAAAVTGLGHARAMSEMQTIFRALEDPDPMVRARATAAVTRITGRRYETYVNGTPQQRHEAAANIRRQWAADEKSTREYYAGKQKTKGTPQK